MRSPRRLVDDPSTSTDLRDALSSEAELVEDHDLEALRARITQGTPAGAPLPAGPRGPRGWWVVGVSGITAAIVTLGLQSLQSPQTVPVWIPTAPIGILETEAMEAPVRTEVQPGVETPSIEEAAQPAVRAIEPAAMPLPAPVPTLAAPEPDPVAAIEWPAIEEAPAPSSVPSNALAKELATYNVALDAASRRDWSIARDAYTTYLATWPNGHLVTEARLGLLTATVESSSPAAAEALASDLLRNGALGSRRNDVELVRAEALVQLGRCDEAMGIIAEMPRESRVNSIRQSCRRARTPE